MEDFNGEDEDMDEDEDEDDEDEEMDYAEETGSEDTSNTEDEDEDGEDELEGEEVEEGWNGLSPTNKTSTVCVCLLRKWVLSCMRIYFEFLVTHSCSAAS